MMYIVMLMWAVTLLLPGIAAAQSTLPTLVVPDCPDLTGSPGAQVCMSVNLESRGASVSSVGFTLTYDTDVLRLPGGAADVQAGSALTGGQQKSAQVQEDLPAGMGTVQVVVIPPVQIPIPVIGDGELCKVCFTVQPGAPPGCSEVTFSGLVDMGNNQGQDLPVEPPADGGVVVDCQPQAELCTGGQDEDCDGMVDCEDADCRAACGTPDHFLCYQAKEPAKLCDVSAPANALKACRREEDCGGVTRVTSLCAVNRFPSNIQAFLTDQFEQGLVDVKGPESLCTPADKNGEGIIDANTHLKGYQITAVAKICAATAPANAFAECRREEDCGGVTRDKTGFCQRSVRHEERTNLRVDNQFGTIVVDTVKPDRLLVPTAKSVTGPVNPPDPTTHNVDHYKCYQVKVTKGTQPLQRDLQAFVLDQFNQPKLYAVQKPTRLCNPVDKNGEGIKDPAQHLLCYQVSQTAKVCTATAPQNPLEACRREEDCGGPIPGTSLCLAQPKHEKVVGLHVNNQFGPEILDTIKEEELCVPSMKFLP